MEQFAGSRQALLDLNDRSHIQTVAVQESASLLQHLFKIIQRSWFFGLPIIKEDANLYYSRVLPQLNALTSIATKVWATNTQIIDLLILFSNAALRPDLQRTWAQQPVRFEDALGRILIVPSEYDFRVSFPIYPLNCFGSKIF